MLINAFFHVFIFKAIIHNCLLISTPAGAGSVIRMKVEIVKLSSTSFAVLVSLLELITKSCPR